MLMFHIQHQTNKSSTVHLPDCKQRSKNRCVTLFIIKCWWFSFKVNVDDVPFDTLLVMFLFTQCWLCSFWHNVGYVPFDTMLQCFLCWHNVYVPFDTMLVMFFLTQCWWCSFWHNVMFLLTQCWLCSFWNNVRGIGECISIK